MVQSEPNSLHRHGTEKRSGRRETGSLLLVLLLLTIPATEGRGQTGERSDDYYREFAEGLELLGQVYREIEERYAGEVDPEELARRGIDGLLSLLDSYSGYIPPGFIDSVRQANLRVGIGLDVTSINGVIVVTDLLAGSPAEQGGVRPGDRILSIDNHPVDSLSPLGLFRLEEGYVGSPLRLGIARPILKQGKEKGWSVRDSLLTIELQRERVRRPSVGWAGYLDGNIAYIDLDRFGENAGNQFRTELIRLVRYEKKPEEVAGVIIDLRGNPGGIIDEAVDVADAIVPKGLLIVRTDGIDSTEREEWYASRDPVAPGMRVVLLVDRGSASASEIVAGALQDHDLATVIGQPTTGKGLVQSVRTLPYGASLRLTTAWYLTPSGRSIQRRDYRPALVPDSLYRDHRSDSGRGVTGGAGIVPDLPVARSAADQFIEQLDNLHLFLTFASAWSGQRESIPSTYHLEDGTLERFRQMAEEAYIRYQEEHGMLASLDSLRQRQQGGETSGVQSAWKQLRQEMIRGWRQQFQEYRSDIRGRLEREIVGLYLTHADRVRLTRENDPVVRRGISLLRRQK